MGQLGPETSAFGELERAFGSALALDLPANKQLFRQGAIPDCVYLLEKGIAKLSYLDPNGKEVIIGLRFSRTVLGMTALVLNCAHSFAAVTVTPCKMLQMRASNFVGLLSRETKISLCLHKLQAQEIDYLLQTFVQMASHSARHRLAKLLLDIALELEAFQPEEDSSLCVPLKQYEIAELLAVTPEHTSRLLRALERDGLVQRKGKSLLILDPKKPLLAF